MECRPTVVVYSVVCIGSADLAAGDLPNFLPLLLLPLLSAIPPMLRPLARGAVRSLCSQCRLITPIHNNNHPFIPLRRLQTSTSPDRVPLRKQLNQDAKALKAQKRQRKESEEASRQEWELTVGVEIHAQLDTAAKLFSRASTSSTDAPNSNVALFDLAFPGSQPVWIPKSLPI